MPDYAPGTQKKLSGEVIRWNNISGPETMDAVKYIELLEAEIEELNRQVARKSSNGQNELLEYLKSLEPQNIKVRRHVNALFAHRSNYTIFFFVFWLIMIYTTERNECVHNKSSFSK